MNSDTIKNAMTRTMGRSNLYIQKHSPEILLGVGLVGGLIAAVMAAKATLKAQEILEDHEAQLSTVENVKEEKAKVYVSTGLKFAKLYGPSVGLGVLSVGAILGAHGIMAKRQVAIVAAYNLISEGYKQYRARVVEELGVEKDQMFHLGLREKNVIETELDDTNDEVISERIVLAQDPDRVGLSMYARCWDNTNPQATGSRLLDRAYLTAQQNFINDKLIIDGYVFLNDVYKRLGFPETPYGQLVGWVLRDPDQMKKEGRDGYISFGLEMGINDDFNRGHNDAIWLDFNVDGEVYNLI